MSIRLDISAKKDIQCRRGDSFRLLFAFKNGDTPMDLAGIIIRMHVKDGANVVLSFEIGNGINITNLLGGEIELIKSKETMAALRPKSYKYDMEFTYPSGERKTILHGAFIVNEDYTI